LGLAHSTEEASHQSVGLILMLRLKKNFCLKMLISMKAWRKLSGLEVDVCRGASGR
jgi:predicted metal-dependent hydrolase